MRSIPFKEISVLSTERLVALQTSDIIDSLIEALNKESNKCSVLHFAFTKCIETMPLDEINQYIFKRILPIMQMVFRTAMTADSQWTDEDLSTCIQLISTLLTNVTAALKRQTASVRFTSLGDLPTFCVKLLGGIFDKIGNSGDTRHDSIAKCARNAQNLLLILFTTGNLVIDSSDGDLTYMEQLLLNVSLLAKLQSDLDEMKLMADTWKCLMALTTKFVNSLTDKYGVSLIWLDQSVETLCTYIKSILDGFRRDPLDDRKLKISLFFAKVLQKLFGDLTKQLYRTSCHRSFIAMLRTYQEIKILHSEDTKISSLNEPLVACLRSIVGHTVTAELLLSESSDGNSCICIEIMKILAKSTAHDHLYLDKEHSRNLLHHLIFTFGIKVSTFMNTTGEIYEAIVLHSAALMVSKAATGITATVVERILAAAIVQENIYVGYLALDIWALYSRHIPSGRQLQYYKYWCKVNFQRSPLNYSVSNGLIKSLLRILFASMPASLQTHIVSQLRSTDFATILAIGWSRMAMCDSNTSRNLLHAMNNDIPKYLSQLTAHKDAKSYYQLIQCLTCVSKGIEFTTLAFDGILMSKLEDLLTTGATEQHAELFTAIATYLTAGNKQYVIADAGKSTHIVATIVRLKCLDIALRQSNNYTESKHFIQAILDGILKGYRDGIDPLEKMLIVRTLCQLNSANVRSDQRDDIESIKHQLYQWMEQSDESCESKYQEIMRDHVLLDVCAAAVPHNPSSQLSRREFTLILDEMEAQARKLENIYNSGARVHQDINHRSYYEQIDRIVNCLNSFKNEN